MDIRELISFYHAASFRSVSRAAIYLDIGQPTVTAHLQRLEKELGVQLFDRVKRPIRLTSEGSNLLEMVTPIVESVEQGLEALRLQLDQPDQQGAFSIGTYSELALNYLAGVIKEYQTLYPGIHIKLVCQSHATLMHLMDDAELDLALVHAPRGNTVGLDFQPLFDSSFVLITPLGHPLLKETRPSLESIARWPQIMLSHRSFARPYLDRAFREAGVEYQVCLELIDNVGLVQRYVEMGMGISIGQDFYLLPEDDAQLGLVNLDYLLSPVPIGIATLPSKPVSSPVHHFIDVLTKWYQGREYQDGSSRRKGRTKRKTL